MGQKKPFFYNTISESLFSIFTCFVIQDYYY